MGVGYVMDVIFWQGSFGGGGVNFVMKIWCVIVIAG